MDILKKTIKFITIIGFFLLIFCLIPTQKIRAGILYPSIVDVFVTQGDSFDGEFSYINTSDKSLNLNISVDEYNAKAGTNLNEGHIFIKPDLGLRKVKPEEQIQVKYNGKVPEDIPIGTYFNVISLIEKTKHNINDQGASLDVLKGEGVLVAIHVLDQTGEMNPSALDIKIAPQRKWFIPRIFPTDAKLTVTNTSPYVISVLGEARLITENGKIVKTVRLSSDEQRLYPDDQIVKEITINPLTFDNTNLVYSFTSNMTTHLFTGTLLLPNYAMASVLSLVITFIAIGIGVAFARIRRNRRVQ